MWPPETTQGLYNYPVAQDAVSWSEDNLLAVNVGSAAVIYNPCDLGGPKAVTKSIATQLQHLQVGAIPEDTDSSLLRQVLCMQQATMNPKQPAACIKSLAWSPTGCSAKGTCILSIVTDDYRVRLFARPRNGESEWHPFADVTELLFKRLEAGNWEEAKIPEDLDAGTETTLRLRGGASGDRPFQVGQKVEVSNDEPGLSGAWFLGTVSEMAENFALVIYDDVNDEAVEPKPLREWFPVDAKCSLDRSDVPEGHPCHTQPGFTMRPTPPPEVVSVSGGLTVGAKVDARHDGVWWPGEVCSLQAAEGKVSVRLSPAKKKRFSISSLRMSVVWVGGSEFTKLSEIRNGVETEPSKPQVVKGQKGVPAEKKSAGNSRVPKSAPAATVSQPHQGVTREEDAAAAALAKLQTNKSIVGVPNRLRPEIHADGLQEMELDGIGPDSDSESASKSQRKAPGRGGRGGSRGVGRASSSKIRGRGRGSDDAKRSRPAELVNPRKKSRKEATVETMGEYLQQEPSSEVDVDESADEFRPDVEKEPGSMEDADDDTCSDEEVREVLKQTATETQRPKRKRRPKGKGTQGAFHKGEPISSPGKNSIDKAAYIAEPYKVPEDFDASVLWEVEDTDKKFMSSIVEVIVHRWLVLRLEIPEEDIPHYNKGGHMRGPDIAAFEQAKAEVLHANKELVERRKLTDKRLTMECKRMIRTTIINPVVKNNTDDEMVSPEEGSEVPGPLADTKKALDRLVKKKDGKSLPAIPDDKAAVRRRVLLQQHFRPRRRASGSADNTIPGREYHRRVQLLMGTTTAWSPIITSGRTTAGEETSAGKFCMLAVGTRAGLVWLWRLQSPAPDWQAEEDEESKGLQLIGSIQVTSGWITALRWAPKMMQGSLVLCAASSNGDVKAAAFQVESLREAVPPPENAVCDQQHHFLGTAIPKDPRGATCIDVSTSGSSGLCVAVGRQAGGLTTWHVEKLDLTRPETMLTRAEVVTIAAAHGSLGVTSVKWLQEPGARGKAAYVASAGLDGDVRVWKSFAQQIVRASEVTPEEAEGDVLPSQVNKNSIHGLTLSGGRFLAAIVRETVYGRLENNQESMTFRKMIKSRLCMIPMSVPDPSWTLAAALRESLQRYVDDDEGRPVKLWDVAAMLHHIQQAEDDANQEAQGAGQAAQGVDQEAPGDSAAVCTAPLTMELLGSLEAEYRRLLSVQGSKRKAIGKVLGDISSTTWRALQSANALRRLLHPLLLAKACDYNGLGEPVQQTELSVRWDAQIRLNEFALLQSHVYRVLSIHGTSGSDVSRLLMADWVSLYEKKMHPELLEARSTTYTAEGGQAPEVDQLPKREVVQNSAVGLMPDVHPLDAALWAEVDLQGIKVPVQRCGASMLACQPSNSWRCMLCKRCFSRASVSRGLLRDLECTFCGLPVSSPMESRETVLTIPGWPT